MPLTDPQSAFVKKHLKSAPAGSPEAENERLAALSDEALIREDLTRGDLDTLFSEDYMLGLMDKTFAGEGTPDLKRLMREIGQDPLPRKRDEIMAELATVLGEKQSDLDADYGRFVQIRRQQEANEKKKGKEDVPALNEDMHPDFMASRGQLMFGQVLGDAFDIHPVFAAMLSPTGGLVGPGNWFEESLGLKAGHLDPDNPIGLHGTVHDAAGYLKSYHNDGPGYNYRESPLEILGDDEPLSGQLTGIYFWVEEVGDEWLAGEADDAVLDLEKKLDGARGAVRGNLDALLAEYEKTKQAGAGFFDWVPDPIAGVAEDMADNLVYGATDAADTAVGVAAEVTEAAGHVAAGGAKIMAETATTAMKLRDNVMEAGEIAGEAAGEVVGAVGEAAFDIAGDVAEGAGAVGAAVGDAASGIAGAASEAVGDMGSAVLDGAKEFVEAENVLERAEAVVGTLQDIGAAGGEAIGDIAGESLDLARDIGGAALDTAGDIVSEVGEAASDIAGAVSDAASDAMDLAEDVAEDLTEAVTDIGDAVGTAAKGVFNSASEIVDMTVKNSWVGKKASSAFNAMSSFLWD